ncbi:hypothetical protein ACIPV2_10010 [Microbacterium sp. NPDC089987]|uniref:hypothetical protein n=1 Tax=Microbacterium sp. NPDC089987 TaxID=3364202 RepID=UPI003812AB9D
MNKTIAPDGTTYTETVAAGNLSRTGITAHIPKADGYTSKTTVWFNGYSSSGDSIATQNGPRGWGKTEAKFLYNLYAPGDKTAVKAWLLYAQLSGTAKTESQSLLTEDPTDVPSVAQITARDLRTGRAGDFALTSYGHTDGGELWTGTNNSFDCIFVAQGDYVASSCNPTLVANERRVSLHALSASHEQSIQVAFSPAGGITKRNAGEAGLVSLSSSVAVNTANPIRGSLTIPSGESRQSQPEARRSVSIDLPLVEEGFFE